MINNYINSNNNEWKGFKECKVYKIVQEDDNVKSFYLNFDDNSKMPYFIAGQFITIRIKNEDGSYTKPRQYTLSMNHNENFYRISVKRESEGYLSKKLCDDIEEGDNIEITMPMGKFVLNDSDRPLVLIGGGIGITPLLTMAYDSIESDRDIYFIYSIPNSKNHSFRDEINKLSKNYKNEIFKKTVFYTRPTENDNYGEDFDVEGRMTKEWMNENLPKNGQFYFCGPIPFMKTIYDNLIEMGIEKDQINYELFGSGDFITK